MNSLIRLWIPYRCLVSEAVTDAMLDGEMLLNFPYFKLYKCAIPLLPNILSLNKLNFFENKNKYRTTIRYFYIPIRTPKKKIIPHAREDVEKPDLSYIAGRNCEMV